MLNILYIFSLLMSGATTLVTLMSLTSTDSWNPISWAIVSLTWYFATYCLSKRLED